VSERPKLKPRERMAIDRYAMPERVPDVRATDFQEVNLGYTHLLAAAEAERCLQCKNPVCIDGCPVRVNIPRFIDLVAEGDLRGAAESLLDDNALPCVTGRVCPQETQCEGKCLRGIKGKPVAIGALERYVADWAMQHADELPHTVHALSGRRVAIVGSGPAGLTAAGELVKSGHQVTIFEAFHAPGGVLIYGIPEFRLPKDIVQAEVDRLKAAGVEIEVNAIIGKTWTLRELRDRYDAVFLAVGAGLPVFMGVPGENLKGVYSANEYLTRVNLMGAFREGADTPVLHGHRVAVVGGGNVAIDAVRTARRLGADDAIIVYRRGHEELPARRRRSTRRAGGYPLRVPGGAGGGPGRRGGLGDRPALRTHGAGRARRVRPSPPRADPRFRVRHRLRDGGGGHRHPQQPPAHQERARPGAQQVGLHRDRRGGHDQPPRRLRRR